MPSSSTGFSGTEIVNRVISYVGNNKTDFQTYVEQTLPLAEFRFCKMHNWRFLYKQNLSLTVSSGTNEYTLDSGSIGYYMAAEDVHTIFDPAQGIVLEKKDLKELRRMDSKNDDGSSTSDIDFWAPTSDNKIYLHPKTFQTTSLKIDGWITPTALTTLSNYPTIPFKYQESFIEYVMAMALDRENDDRAEAKKASAIELMRLDIRNDVQSRGDTDQPRVRSMAEAAVDGVGGEDAEQAWLNWLFR